MRTRTPGPVASCGPASPAPATTVPRAPGPAGALRLYVGTYTGSGSRGIYLLELDPSSGRFTSGPALVAETENPSFLALHPDGRCLYAVNELRTWEGAPTGAVSAFALDGATGRLAFLNRQRSEGTDPCHLVVDPTGRHVLVANYSSGTVAVLPLSADGRLQPASDVRRRSGFGPVTERQEGPHAHMVSFDPSGRFVLSTDLGADRVVLERFHASSGTLVPTEPGGVAIEPGSGPRHLAWHPSGRVAYLLNELSATVTALRFDAAGGALETLQTVPARPAGASVQNTAAEIAVSPDGRFVYASNRGDDTLAVFAVDAAGSRLEPATFVPAGGRGPRSFAIDPTGRWLVAANQGSGSLMAFRLDPRTGLPAAVGEPIAVPEPVCVLFAKRIESAKIEHFDSVNDRLDRRAS